MARKKAQSKVQSPYQKYGKTPYIYNYKKCSHKNEENQSVIGWKGKICTVCNIITGTFNARES